MRVCVHRGECIRVYVSVCVVLCLAKKKKTCKENCMIAKTCSQDGRREATRTDATIDAFKEMLLVNFGLLSAPGGLIVEPE